MLSEMIEPDADAQEEPQERPVMPLQQTNEVVNAVTHAFGLLLSIVGAIVLMASARSHGDAYLVAACAVFSFALIAVYAASTLSHLPFGPPGLMDWFRRLDQGFIYLLIVGTPMPLAVVYLRTGWWFLFFAVMWTVALCGFFSKILFSHRLYGVALWIYVLLGWMPIVTVPWLVGVVPVAVLGWMLVGGLCYTCGTLFLANDTRHPFYHGVWHLFVIAGSTCHFVTTLCFVCNPR
jgi:hemolysin III